MPAIGLTPLPVQDLNAASLLTFFTNLVGQLAALPDVLVACARREGRQVVEATERLILLRVRLLAPNFPFAALLEEFITLEEKNEATAAVEPVIDEVKEAAKRDWAPAPLPPLSRQASAAAPCCFCFFCLFSVPVSWAVDAPNIKSCNILTALAAYRT